MIPTYVPTSAVQKEAFPLAGMLRVVKFFGGDEHVKNLSKLDTKAPNEARLTVIRVSNEARLGGITPTQSLTISKRVSVAEPQPLKSYGLHWLDHYQRNPCYIQPVPAKSGTGRRNPYTPKATPDAHCVFFCVDATAHPFITVQIRTESMVALAGRRSRLPVSFVSGIPTPVNVTAISERRNSGGDSLNTKEAAIWLLPPPKNRLLSGAFTLANNHAISLLPLALNPKPDPCYPIAHACLLPASAQGALMLSQFTVLGYGTNQRGLTVGINYQITSDSTAKATAHAMLQAQRNGLTRIRITRVMGATA